VQRWVRNGRARRCQAAGSRLPRSTGEGAERERPAGFVAKPLHFMSEGFGAGIKKVVYIEPYPKSKAAKLHDDAITLTEETRDRSAAALTVPFVPFVGVSPRKYAELFTVKPLYGRDVDRKTQVYW
jgi:hypothetical protein